LVEMSPLTDEVNSRETDSFFITSKSELGREVCKSDIVNRVNYANFENLELTVLFKHKIYDRTLSFSACPEPCLGNNLILKWINPIPENEDLSQFKCLKILIPSFGQFILLIVNDYSLSKEGISLDLPDVAFELKNRKK
jgi:hypothetical protein